MKDVTLVLQDGTEFKGKSFGYEQGVTGEVVFNTAMMGYPESLTDPSYAGQLLVMTSAGWGIFNQELNRQRGRDELMTYKRALLRDDGSVLLLGSYAAERVR